MTFATWPYVASSTEGEAARYCDLRAGGRAGRKTGARRSTAQRNAATSALAQTGAPSIFNKNGRRHSSRPLAQSCGRARPVPSCGRSSTHLAKPINHRISSRKIGTMSSPPQRATFVYRVFDPGRHLPGSFIQTWVMPVGACYVLTPTRIPMTICHPCVAGTYFSLGLCIAHPLYCKNAHAGSLGVGMIHGMASSPRPRFRGRFNVYGGNAHTGGGVVAITDALAPFCYQIRCGPPTHPSSIIHHYNNKQWFSPLSCSVVTAIEVGTLAMWAN